MVKISDKVFAIGMILILSLGIACGYLFFYQYPMEWSKQSVEQDPELEEIKKNLIELGFPEHILEDLLEEDIRACKDACYVFVDSQDHCLNDGHVVEVSKEAGTFLDRYYDVKELRTTGIGVLISAEKEQWKIFHHFQYILDTEFYGTECIQLQSYSENWELKDTVTGQVLYDLGGQTYTAPYYSLGNETYSSVSMFGGMAGGDIAVSF